MLISMDNYYRGNRIDISLCSVKFHSHFGLVLHPSFKNSNDLPHPACLLLFLFCRWGQTITSRTSMPVAEQLNSFVFRQTDQQGFPTPHIHGLWSDSHAAAPTASPDPVLIQLPWDVLASSARAAEVLFTSDAWHTLSKSTYVGNRLHWCVTPALSSV